jgi:DNA-binding response OmpR family regulator
LDLNTDGITPEEFMSRLAALYKKKEQAKPLVGILSAVPNVETHAKDLGADFSFQKPFEMNEFLAFLCKLSPSSGRVLAEAAS